jgi:hypothetical protein
MDCLLRFTAEPAARKVRLAEDAWNSRDPARRTRLLGSARAGIELTLETAKELRAALDRAIAAAEFEEAEVRGKGAAPKLVRAA